MKSIVKSFSVTSIHEVSQILRNMDAEFEDYYLLHIGYIDRTSKYEFLVEVWPKGDKS